MHLVIALIVIVLGSFSSAYAQSGAAVAAMDAACGDQQGCITAALAAAAETPADAPAIAVYALGRGPAGVGAGIAAGMATQQPDAIADIIAEMAAAAPEDTATFVIAAVGVFPAEQRPDVFERIMAKVRARVPALANQLDPAGILPELPGFATPPGLTIPNVGLLGFDVISPS